MLVPLNRRAEGIIIAVFIALFEQGIRFFIEVTDPLVLKGVPLRHQICRFREQLSSLRVMQFSQRQIAFRRARSSGLNELLILSKLGLLTKDPCLLCGRNLRLPRLAKEADGPCRNCQP